MEHKDFAGWRSEKMSFGVVGWLESVEQDAKEERLHKGKPSKLCPCKARPLECRELKRYKKW